MTRGRADPSGDVDYKLERVLVGRPQHVGRLAVLYPSARPSRPRGSKELLRVGRGLLNLWRRSLTRWGKTAGAPLGTPSSLARMRNCPPAFFRTRTDGSVPCHRDALCPWCHGRKVADLYRRVASVLEAPDAGWSLLVALGKNSVPYSDPSALPGALDRQRLSLSRLARNVLSFGPGGAYYSVAAEPGGGSWLVSGRLLVVRPGAEPEPPVPDPWRVRSWARPGEKEVAAAVAAAVRYPVGLLFGDPTRSLSATLARRGLKLSNYSGVLRGRAGAPARRKPPDDGPAPALAGKEPPTPAEPRPPRRPLTGPSWAEEGVE